MDMKPLDAYNACVDSLGEYVRQAGFTDVVLGLSGGLDSSVVAAMACDALGHSHVHGFMLPGPFSTARSITDARNLAHNLDLSPRTISITLPYENVKSVYHRGCDKPMGDLASQNTQARLRMVVLMAVSNDNGWLLLNTGNKSEAMMGYSTLYGDTAGAFAPLGGLYKTDVYAVARARNQKAIDDGQVNPIPGSVLTKPPSAELAKDQVDEEALGLSYPELDRILVGHFEYGKPASDLATDESDVAKVENVIARAKSYAYKRAMEPPFPTTRFYAQADSQTPDSQTDSSDASNPSASDATDE